MSETLQKNSEKKNTTPHVLTLTPFFPSDRNPVNGSFIVEPIRRFDRAEIDSTVIAVAPVYRANNKAILSAPATWVRYPSLPGTVGLASAGTFLYHRLAPLVRELQRRKPVDVIHAHGALPCGHAAELLGKKLGVPFIVTVHGLDAFNACSESGAASRRRQEKSLEVYAAARAVICISDKVQEIVRTSARPETKTSVIPNGVDTELFSPRPFSHAQQEFQVVPQILVVGTLIRSKGHALVLKAIARLSTSFPTIQCRIIGEGPDRPEFEALARELRIAGRVQFAGRQSREEVARAMQCCSVFILPSSNEALGCVYLEAMACAKPVIGCQGQGIDGIIVDGKNGFLIPPDGLDQLNEKVAALLKAPERAQQVGTAARETVLRGFTLDHQAQQLGVLYREIAERVARPDDTSLPNVISRRTR